MDSEYKKYSLEKLQEWVHDALSAGQASPHEIYSAIREAVREDYYYYKDHVSRAYGLLALLSGERPVKDENEDDGMRPWGHSDLEYQIANNKKGLFVGWNYSINQSEDKKDKVKKWVLPVEECKDADTDETDYFVSFPDDLLEAADLKEGDQVEWIDQGDGSFLLKKCNKGLPTHKELLENGYKTYEEAVADGWEMTADGFWIKSHV